MFHRPDEILAALPADRPLLALLDYDGTVVAFHPEPGLAVPDPELLDLLARLAGRPDSAVALVSGRSAEDLERLFPGQNLRALALHGAQYLEPGSPPLDLVDLRAARESALALAEACRPLRSIPGVLLEEKGASVCLHTRACSPEDEREAARRFRALAGAAGRESLEVLEGSKVLEARPRGADKGRGILWLLARLGREWFPIYLGDDLTDEDAFRVVNPIGASVGVGLPRHASRARFRLPDPAAARDLLRALARRPRALRTSR